MVGLAIPNQVGPALNQGSNYGFVNQQPQMPAQNHMQRPMGGPNQYGSFNNSYAPIQRPQIAAQPNYQSPQFETNIQTLARAAGKIGNLISQ